MVDYSRTIVVHAGAGESGFLLPNQSASPSFVSARGPAGATARPVNCRVCGGRWFAWLSPPPGRVVPHSRVCESVRVCSGHGALRLPRVVRPVHGAACHRRVACHLCRRCRVLSPPPPPWPLGLWPAVAGAARARRARCRAVSVGRPASWRGRPGARARGRIIVLIVGRRQRWQKVRQRTVAHGGGLSAAAAVW